MTNKTQKTQTQEQKQVNVFGDIISIEKKINVKEFAAILRQKFEDSNKQMPVGQLSYYGLVLKQAYGLSISHEALAEMTRVIFELNGLVTENSGKCVGYYQSKLNKGLIDTTRPMTSQKQVAKIDVRSLFD